LLALRIDTARGVILFSKQDRNTTAPAGALANSGWQFQGNFRGFLATPISKKYFITAGHIGGITGNKMQIGGRSFTTTAHWDDPASDLRIYTVNKKFNAWAPLHTAGREVGKHAMIIGRGAPRGAEVQTPSLVTHGWEWGIQDAVQSWGLNQIDTITQGTAEEGDLLQFDFDGATAGIGNEGTLAIGDSGGGVFFYDKKTKQWQLAGINYAVDGPFARSAGGQTFQASLFDIGGFFYGDVPVTDTALDVPVKNFATRISSKMDWINGVLRGTIPPTMIGQGFAASTAASKVPEPAAAAMLLLAAPALMSRRRRGRRRA
jgi:hypothetical protein